MQMVGGKVAEETGCETSGSAEVTFIETAGLLGQWSFLTRAYSVHRGLRTAVSKSLYRCGSTSGGGWMWRWRGPCRRLSTAEWGEWPASRMTRNSSSVERSKTGSQSNTSRHATFSRSSHSYGAFPVRAGHTSARMTMALTSRPLKRGCALRYAMTGILRPAGLVPGEGRTAAGLTDGRLPDRMPYRVSGKQGVETNSCQ